MSCDARKKGGTYSDNPKIRRTVEYLKNIPAEKRDEQRKNFLEYRSLRTTCIPHAKKTDYQQSCSRNDKINMLREACHNAIANRYMLSTLSFFLTSSAYHCLYILTTEYKRIEYKGIDIDAHVARFHDRAFVSNTKKNASASNSASTPSPVNEAGNSNPDTEQPANTLNGSQTTAPASSPAFPMADSIDHHNHITAERDEELQLLEKDHELILPEMSVRAYIRFQTAHKLRRLVEDAGF
ncbi:hypothetical protein LZ32DRAFT_633212 [Colletotrichum eremochloae]|nr:hypothetical protein LZ32DRAFT_633212 [Colletotrichum eremochloae]